MLRSFVTLAREANHGYNRCSGCSNVGCWNMRSLVESDGSIATSVSRQGGRGVAVDKKSM